MTSSWFNLLFLILWIPQISYTQNPKAAFIQNPKVAFIQNPKVAFIQNPEVALIQNPKTTLMQNPKAAFIQNPKATLIQNPEVAFIQNPKVALIQNPKAAFIQNPEVAFIQNPKATLIHKFNLMAKTNYYNLATKYFTKRKRILHHYLDFGISATLIESIYPLETTAHPFFIYLNYRREKWGKLKVPIIFSIHYGPFLKNYNGLYTFIGVRNNMSHDLKLFYIDFLIGGYLPLDFSIQKVGLELRLLFVHIIGPKNSTNRLYFKWGPKLQITTDKQIDLGLIIQLGIDNHL